MPPDTTRRLPSAAVPILVALAAFAWLAWPGGDPLAPLAGTDVIYHLHRISRCLADFPWVTSVDRFAHAGADWHLPWPGPLTLVLASLARLLGPDALDLAALGRTLSFVAPVLGATAAAATVLLARACGLREPQALVAGLCVALSGDATMTFHRGVVDHHAWGAALVPLALLAWSRRSLGGWALVLVLLGMTTPLAPGWLAMGLIILIASEGWGAAHAAMERLPRAGAFFLAPAACLALAWLADRLLDPERPALLDSSIFRLSLSQVACLMLLGASGAAAALLPRRGRTRGERLSALGGVLLGAGAVLMLALLVTDQLGRLLEHLAGQPGLDPGASRSPLHVLAEEPASPGGAWAALLLLALVASAGRALLALQRRSSPRELAMATLVAGALLLALISHAQARSLAPIVVLALAWSASDAATLLASVRPGSRALAVLATGWILVLALPVLLWHGVVSRQALRAQASWPADVGELAAAARRILPAAGSRSERPTRQILAPWEWGNHLNVLGGQPVVLDGFHPAPEPEGAEDTWLALSGDEFAAKALQLGATHLALGGGSAGLSTILRGDRAKALDAPANIGGLAWPSSLRRLALFRLEESGGLSDDSGHLLLTWASPRLVPLAIADTGGVRVAEVPASRLYEIVPGVTVSGTAPPATDLLTMETSIRIADGPTLLVVRRIPVDAAGYFRFRCSIPAPWRSAAYEVSLPHRLRGRTGETSFALPAEAIRHGASFTLPAAMFLPAGEPPGE